MANNNPFEPPRATVGDVESGTERYQAVSAFTYKGRIGRLRYIAYGVAGYFVVGIVAVAFGALTAMLHLPQWVASAAALIPYAIVFCALTIQRSHDMNWSGWTSLLALIPLVGLLWLFKAGTDGENRFGARPVPNTTGVKVLALLLPAIFVIGIVAAVALPAYSEYVKRAKAQKVGLQLPDAPMIGHASLLVPMAVLRSSALQIS